MKDTSKIITFLRSSRFAIIVAILSMIVQSPHSFTAFYETGSLHNAWGIAQAVLFAVIIDSAILFYTVRNRTDIALGAAFIMVIINSFYYYQHLGLTFSFAFGVFLSLIIPASVYFYSEEVGKDELITPVDFESYEEGKLKAEVERISRERDWVNAELDKYKSIVDAGQAENKRLISMIDHERDNCSVIERKCIAIEAQRDSLVKQLAEYDASLILAPDSSEGITMKDIKREIDDNERKGITRTDQPLR